MNIKGLCKGDSGAPVWKTKQNKEKTESVSTVLGVLSHGASHWTCTEPSWSHKINHKDVLMWISENWVK